MAFLNIAPDKWKHFYVGYLMAYIFQLGLELLLGLHFTIALGINLLLVNVIGFGFELFSYLTKKGHAEIKDAFATFIGGGTGALIIGIAEYSYAL